MIKIKLLFFILLTTIIQATPIIINEKSSNIELLSQSFIYEDNTKSLTIEDIQEKDIEFKTITQSRLSFGYSPDFDVWIKFTLHNQSDKVIEKIIEYANPLTTHINFFEISTKSAYKDGLLQINKSRKTLNPYFEILLEPNETKIYYIKASSYITTLIVQLNLWDIQEFYNKELKHQSILQLFFGAMFILAFYNIFIYFFTKDISYLYYVLYLVGISIHHLMYTGMAHIYLIKNEWLIYSVQYAAIFIALPVFFLALFSKTFIKTIQYPIWNKILNILIFLIPITVLLFMILEHGHKYRNLLSIVLLIYLIMLVIYASFKKNRQAYFILGGWLIVFIGGITMYLSSTGILNIYQYFPYIVELTFISEALLFSIALADKINNLQYEKNIADKKLIIQQETENERLSIEVKEKTKKLQESLNQQTTLLKELNHRVKNNMQTIISLIRLQADEVSDEEMQNTFTTIQNRINAMSHLHELLYKQHDISHINAHEYFDNLIMGLQDSFENEIDILYDIDVKLEVETAISCGLILNELITNSFKYAFEEDIGKIIVKLHKVQNTFYLSIEDNGKGYDPNTVKHSFGLILVKTLVQDHLRGEILITIKDGVKNTIIWREND